MMNNEAVEDINENLETIWQRLEGIEYHLQQIAVYGILSREVEEAIVAIARSISKPYDEKYKDMLNQEAGKV